MTANPSPLLDPTQSREQANTPIDWAKPIEVYRLDEPSTSWPARLIGHATLSDRGWPVVVESKDGFSLCKDDGSGFSMNHALRNVLPLSAPAAQWTPTPHEPFAHDRGVTLWNTIDSSQSSAVIAVDGERIGFISSNGPGVVTAALARHLKDAIYPHRPAKPDQWLPDHYAAIKEFAASVRASRGKCSPAPTLPVLPPSPQQAEHRVAYDAESWPKGVVWIRQPGWGAGLRSLVITVGKDRVFAGELPQFANTARDTFSGTRSFQTLHNDFWQLSTDGGVTWQPCTRPASRPETAAVAKELM